MARSHVHTTAEVLAEITDGQAMLPGELARYAPPGRSGRRGVSPQTVVRWIVGGMDGPRGRVRLEAAVVAGRLVSTRGALARFVRAQQSLAGGY